MSPNGMPSSQATQIKTQFRDGPKGWRYETAGSLLILFNQPALEVETPLVAGSCKET